MALIKSRNIRLSRSSFAGFTLIEVVIVLAVITVVSLITAPLGIQFYDGQTITGAQGRLGDALTRARSQSVVQENDIQYGVCLIGSGNSTSTYVLYAGAAGSACVTHNNPTDELSTVNDGTVITFPGSATEINFAKHTGIPSATGTISIVWNGYTRTLTVDSLGTIVEK